MMLIKPSRPPYTNWHATEGYDSSCVWKLLTVEAAPATTAADHTAAGAVQIHAPMSEEVETKAGKDVPKAQNCFIGSDIAEKRDFRTSLVLSSLQSFLYSSPGMIFVSKL